MRFGVARDLVTPDLKVKMAGFGIRFGKFFEAIHDDLYVKVLLLDDGKRRAMLITYDLLMHDYTLTDRIGEYVQTRHGIDRQHLVVSYTHTHNGPELEGYNPGQ